MTTSRFDQDPNAGYGQCSTCETEFATEVLAREHMADTLDAARASGENTSHRISVLNISREDRIESHVGSIVENAMSEAIDQLLKLIDSDDVTEDEVTRALGDWLDFNGAWKNALPEDRD